ncbi:MAG: hypothetical protein M0R33_13880 [Methylomonas sp.]|jgi:hypothetical protein|uniref:hypothetical protein n=1 Tax=Methylomonas sp. TaxID=418 RepID=UPI0025EC60EA|nr:hypothetical protein [Methylomonas sp.]MCK9607525.1 hypothetical protein [Methylomonas sp.]
MNQLWNVSFKIAGIAQDEWTKVQKDKYASRPLPNEMRPDFVEWLKKMRALDNSPFHVETFVADSESTIREWFQKTSRATFFIWRLRRAVTNGIDAYEYDFVAQIPFCPKDCFDIDVQYVDSENGGIARGTRTPPEVSRLCRVRSVWL